MSIARAFIPVDRGTLVFPWGKNCHTIQVEALKPAQESVEVKDFIGPGMNGYPNNATTRPANTVQIIGWYTAADATAMLGRTGMRGTTNIQIGRGETWTGTCILQSIQAEPSLAVVPDVTSGARIKVRASIIFAGAVTRTPIPAGT